MTEVAFFVIGLYVLSGWLKEPVKLPGECKSQESNACSTL